MIDTVVIRGYRALRNVRFAPRQLTLVTGANGTGKSSLYRALSLLQRAATGGLGMAIAQEGGIGSLTWAGVGEADAGSARKKQRPIQGTAHRASSTVLLGLSCEGIGFELELGMPDYDPESRSPFNFDPGVVRECLWVGAARNRHSICLERKGPSAQCFDVDRLQHVVSGLLSTESAISALRDPKRLPELHAFREHLRSFRFYDGFRVDAQSPLRQPTIGVRSPVLEADGSNLAACVQTILEIGDGEAFRESIRTAVGAEIEVLVSDGPRFEVATRVQGVLRPLRAHEHSDGTLRYIALAASLFAPRPPPVAVFNEPEASLHPSLLAPLAQAILHASQRTQLWVVTHNDTLAAALRPGNEGSLADIALERGDDGATGIRGQRLLDVPSWPD
ncbi:MAG TPA: AAA family ATPase [Polyangiales bacterium]|nr:AAA family ATPase [Polyangiales bacterium]